MDESPHTRRRRTDAQPRNSFAGQNPPTNPVREAIDETLSTVHMTARDKKAVLRGVRKAAKRRRRSAPRFGFAFAFSLLLIAALPLLLRQGGTIPTINPGIATFAPLAPGQSEPADAQATPTPAVTAQPTPAPTAQPTPTPSAAPMDETTLTQDALMLAARACFEAQCDTSVYTFDEYTADVEPVGSAQCVVTLKSIYQNGCTFIVVLDTTTGDVLQYSSPRLATVPSGGGVQNDENPSENP